MKKQTMFDYIKEQDKSFTEKPFTNADAAILSTIANIDFSSFYDKDKKEKVSLKELADAFLGVCSPNDDSYEVRLMRLIGDSPRYGEVLASDIVSEVDVNREKQFGAMVFWPENSLPYIGFTGTGTSITGYKEDLNMSYMDVVPAQLDSVMYINSVGAEIEGDLIVGGFSKGGNLAVFGSAFARPDVRERIKKVYNHDGPGFSKTILDEPKYQSILPLVEFYVPVASIVGLMLKHNNDFKIIDSVAPPIAQHQPYSWVFEGDDLSVLEDLSTTSRFTRSLVNNLLARMDEERRKDSIDAVFGVINNMVEGDDLNPLMNSDTKIAPAITKSLSQADKDTKLKLLGLAKDVGTATVMSLKKGVIKKKIDWEKRRQERKREKIGRKGSQPKT